MLWEAGLEICIVSIFRVIVTCSASLLGSLASPAITGSLQPTVPMSSKHPLYPQAASILQSDTPT